jgi:uncharacterized protein YyaL (SSP411 family)
MERAPAAAGQMLIALDMWRGPANVLVLLGGQDEQANQRLIAALQQSYRPFSVVAYRSAAAGAQQTHKSASLEPLFAGRSFGEEPALFICQNFSCQAPIKGAAKVAEAIERL